MFQQAKFVKLFYSQKKVSSDSNVYHDIYDATIWKEFSSSLLNPSVPFLSDPNNLTLHCCSMLIGLNRLKDQSTKYLQ